MEEEVNVNVNGVTRRVMIVIISDEEMTDEKLKDIPKYEDIDDEDPLVYRRYVSPIIGWQWFPFSVELNDPDYGPVFYGYVRGIDDECGDFTVDELKDAMVEEDKEFKPMPYSEINAKYPNTNKI